VQILAGGLCFLNAIACVIFMEETNYVRELPIPGPPATESAPLEHADISDDKDIHGVKNTGTQVVQDVPAGMVSVTEERNLEGTPKNFVQRMGFQPVRGGAKHTFFCGVVQPLWAMAVTPLIWYGGFQYGMYQVSRYASNRGGH
jgi:hypothetical protein